MSSGWRHRDRDGERRPPLTVGVRACLTRGGLHVTVTRAFLNTARSSDLPARPRTGGHRSSPSREAAGTRVVGSPSQLGTPASSRRSSPRTAPDERGRALHPAGARVAGRQAEHLPAGADAPGALPTAMLRPGATPRRGHVWRPGGGAEACFRLERRPRPSTPGLDGRPDGALSVEGHRDSAYVASLSSGKTPRGDVRRRHLAAALSGGNAATRSLPRTWSASPELASGDDAFRCRASRRRCVSRSPRAAGRRYSSATRGWW